MGAVPRGRIQAVTDLREITMVMVSAEGSVLPLRPGWKILTGLTLWLTMVATAGCDSAVSRSAPTSRGENARIEKLKTGYSVDEAREIAGPIGETPGLSVDKTAAEKLASGNEVFSGELEPPKGLKTQRLFGTAAANDDERFERLELALQQLRDDFDAVNPSINRLIAIEREIQSLVDQLNVLVANDGQPVGAGALDTGGVPIPPVPAAMVEEPAAEFPDDPALALSPPVPLAPPLAPQSQPAVAAASAGDKPKETPPPAAPSADLGKMLQAVRAADHEGSTRVVFEMNADLAYSAAVDPEKILLVTFKQGGAESQLTQTKIASQLITSIDVTPQAGGGVIVALGLAKDTKILRQGVLKPDAGNPRYRLYIDLQK